MTAGAVRADATGGGVPAAEAPAGSQPAPRQHNHEFDLWELDVVGNTVLDEALVQDTLAPFLGPGKTLDDVDNARQTLETLYRDKGFKTVSVAIPKQKVKDGVVTLQVTEDKVGHLTVIGSKYHSIDKIKQEMPTVAEGSVPDWEKLRAELITIDQQQDLTVTPSLKAGTAPGTVDMDLVVDDKLPLHGMVELNNRYSANTEHNRVLGNLSYGNLWQRGDSISVTYETAPQDPSNARIVFGNYLATFGDSPFSLLFSGLHTTSNVTTLGSITVIGAGKSYGAQGVWKLPDGKDVSSDISAGITYKNFNSVINEGAGAAPELTPLVYYPISLGYSRFGHSSTSNTEFDASMNFADSRRGLPTDSPAACNVAGSTLPQTDPSFCASLDNSHYGARSNMFYLRSSYSWTQDLPGHLQTFLRVNGQMTDQPLVSNEEMSAGGLDTARGYLEAEALGDEGVESSFELRAPSLPDLISNAGFDRHVQDLRPFIFLDQAWLRMHGPFPDAESATADHLLSTGIGLNLNMFDALHGVLDLGHPLVNGPTTKAGVNRVSFRVWATF